MRKLGKKTHEMVESVEAYCNCSACYTAGCSCRCICSPSSTPLDTIGVGAYQSTSSNNKYGANYNVGNGTTYNS